MEYKEAVKKIQARKPKDNYMIIKMGYENTVVLPHKDGMSLIASLATAEQYNDPYGKVHSITELDRNKITVTTMSSDEYDRHKIAVLLGMTLDEVKEHQLQAN
mgnify:CR=1 FL=1